MSYDFSSTKHTPADGLKILAMNGTTAGYVLTEEMLNNYILASKGQASGLATLDENGKLPSTQLPEFANDVLVYASKDNFPATGSDGILYIATDTKRPYIWADTAYAELTVDMSAKEDVANKVTSYGSGSTDDEYPTAKAVYDSEESIKGDISNLEDKVGVYDFTEVDDNTTVTLDGDQQSELEELVQKSGTYANDGIMLSLEPDIPSSTSHSFGVRGQIALDDNYLYVCTADNTWKKLALEAL